MVNDKISSHVRFGKEIDDILVEHYTKSMREKSRILAAQLNIKPEAAMSMIRRTLGRLPSGAYKATRR